MSLKIKPEVSIFQQYKMTPLHQALFENDSMQKIVELIQQESPLAQDSFNMSPLHWAVELNLIPELKILAQNYPSYLEIINNQQESALDFALNKENHRAVKILLEAGANPNKRPTQAFPPLIRSIQNGNLEILKLLLAYGANPNETDAFNRSAFIWAAIQNFSIGLIYLVNAGADTCWRDDQGKNALDCAKQEQACNSNKGYILTIAYLEKHTLT